MGKRILAAAAVLSMLSLAACGNDASSGDGDGNKLTIGAVGPQSGVGAEYGDQFKKGLELALEEVKAGEDPVDIEIIYCDDENDSAKSVVCARKLASEGAQLLVSATSQASLPISGFNEQEEFLLLGASQAPELTAQGNKLVVRAYPDPTTSDPEFASRAYDLLNSESDVESVAIMEVNTDLGKAYRGLFTEGWEEAGGTVTGVAPYAIEETDFARQIQSLLADDPDAIVLTTLCSTSAIVVKQARQLGFEGPFINSSACSGGDALTEFVDADRIGDFYSAVFASSFVDGDNVLPFNAAFEEKYGAAPTQVSAAMGYLDIHWAALALAEAGGVDDLTALRDAFGTVQGDLGEHNVFGLKDFDAETGNSSGELAIGLTGTETDGKLIRVDQS